MSERNQPWRSPRGSSAELYDAATYLRKHLHEEASLKMPKLREVRTTWSCKASFAGCSVFGEAKLSSTSHIAKEAFPRRTDAKCVDLKD